MFTVQEEEEVEEKEEEDVEWLGRFRDGYRTEVRSLSSG